MHFNGHSLIEPDLDLDRTHDPAHLRAFPRNARITGIR
jgi:hypothetical protein